MVVGIVPTAILTVPTSVIRYAGHSAWISMLLSTLLTVLVALLVSGLIRFYNGKSLFELLRQQVGAWAAAAAGLLLALYYWISMIDILHQFTDFVREKLLSRTPNMIICMVILAVAIYAVDQGLTVLANTSSVLIVGSGVTMCLSTVLFFNLMQPGWVLPLTGVPAIRIIQGSFGPISWLSEISFLLLIAHRLKPPVKTLGLTVGVSLITGFTLLWVILGTIMILGPDIPKLLNYASFSVFGVVEIGEFVQRIDIIFVAIWMSTMFMKLAVYVYGCIYCLRETLKLTRQRAIYFPLSVLTCEHSTQTWIMGASFRHFTTYNLYSYVGNILIPALLVLVLWLTRHRKADSAL